MILYRDAFTVSQKVVLSANVSWNNTRLTRRDGEVSAKSVNAPYVFTRLGDLIEGGRKISIVHLSVPAPSMWMLRANF